MRQLLLLLLLSGCISCAWGQQASIKGKVVDTLEKKNLPYAVVSLLRRSDSTLFTFTRTDQQGSFTLKDVAAGQYVLLVTYPKFADYADELNVQAGEAHEAGTVPLTLKSRLLDAVIIKSSGAIRIKGDTTEFVADSFKVREGATVEDLLKKFPGFQVNAKGEITAQGKRVDKVLVDGEEFFGDDPTMATQNLSSKAVDKVQLFDTKSDEQNLTGIGSGGNTKTLNIKLKDEFKKGAFGKVEGASDFNRYHDAKALYNRFRGKEKLSLYATKSSTSAGNISWQDRNKFGLDNNDYEYDEVGGFFFSFSEGDEFSDWNLRGLPDAYTAGGVYINKWNNENQSINGSYLYNRLGTDNEGRTFTKSILPDSVLYTQKDTKGYSLLQQHAPTFKYVWKIDSLTTLTLKSTNSYKTNHTVGTTSTETETDALVPLNTSTRFNDNTGTKTKSDNLLTYKKVFKKTGRSMSASLHQTYAHNEEDNFILSDNRFYANGLPSFRDSTDQQKIIRSNSSTIGASVSWTEPLTKTWRLLAKASYNTNKSTAHLNTFNKNIDGKYENFEPYYSNNFDYHAEGTSGTLMANYATKKINFAAGSGLSHITQRVFDMDSAVRNTYRFTRLLPQVQFRYSPKNQTFLGFQYRGASQQPTIEQLQPLRNNTDPLNVFIGNPDLKVGFNHHLNVNFGSFQVLKQRYVYIGLDYTTVSNAVTTSSTIDANGRKISTNVNANGNSNWQLWSMWNKNGGEGKWNYGANLNGTSGRSVTFVNGRKSSNRFTQYNFSINVNKGKENKWNVSFEPNFGQNFSSSSLQPENKTKYISWGGNTNGSIHFGKKFELYSEVQANLRQRISASDTHPNVFLWNARFSRQLFKKDVAKISIVANDILDQNKGVNRVINSNFIIDERYLQVSRYFQLKFEWSFNNNPASK
jgi:hypothetical protein